MGKATEKELQQIGETIRFLRRCRGMGQEVLAEAAGVSNMTISRIENGTTVMNILTLKKIAAILKVSAEEILIPERKISKNYTNVLVNYTNLLCTNEHMFAIMRMSTNKGRFRNRKQGNRNLRDGNRTKTELKQN